MRALIAIERGPPKVTSSLEASRLLAMTKSGGEVRPIAVGKVLHRLFCWTVVWQMRAHIAPHLAPHKLDIATPGDMEAVVRGL